MLANRRCRQALAGSAIVWLGFGLAGCGSSGVKTASSTSTPTSRQVQETAAVRLDGQALPRYRGLAYDDDAVDEQAPDVTGEDFDGNKVTLAADPGGPSKLVVFFAHWMSFSDEAAGTFGSWLSDADVPSDVSLYVVSSYVRPSATNYPPSQWLHGRLSSAWSRVHMVADSAASEAAKAYGTERLPFWVFLDPDNNVVARYAGQLSGTELDALIESLASGDGITLPTHGWRGITPSGSPEPTETTEPEPTQTTEPEPTPTPTGAPSFQLTAKHLMSMIGRQLTEDDVRQLSAICYRNYQFRQDIHCEEERGFGLSVDNDTVREVYLYDYVPPDQSSFPAALPGGMRWNSTLADIIDTLGRPECVTSIIGYGLHYTMGELDVEYSVTADMEPTADLEKIIVRAAADRPASCHPYTR